MFGWDEFKKILIFIPIYLFVLDQDWILTRILINSKRKKELLKHLTGMYCVKILVHQRKIFVSNLELAALISVAGISLKIGFRYNILAFQSKVAF